MEKEEDYIKESQIGNNPDSLTPDQMKQALYQIERCVCKIKDGNLSGTGFFCKIPFPNSFNLLPSLITCNHVLNNNCISPGKTVNFSINNEQYSYSILINDSRKTYTNENLDITIIEIKPEEDKIEFESFLDVDENIYKNNIKDIYEKKTVYIIHYEEGQNVKYSNGMIINTKNSLIKHYCRTRHGSSGSPIINLLNFKVMGIHKGSTKGKIKNMNLGTLIKFPIEFFNEFYKNKKILSESNKSEKQKKVLVERKILSLSPSYLKYNDGLNLFWKCLNKKCKAYEKEVSYPFGFGEFDLIKDLNIQSQKCPKCPYCNFPVLELLSCRVMNCRYKYEGKYYDKNTDKIDNIIYSQLTTNKNSLEEIFNNKDVVWINQKIVTSPF